MFYKLLTRAKSFYFFPQTKFFSLFLYFTKLNEKSPVSSDKIAVNEAFTLDIYFF